MVAGLLEEAQIVRFEEREQRLEVAKDWCERHRVKPTPEFNAWLHTKGSASLRDGILVSQLVRRPELGLRDILSQLPFGLVLGPDEALSLEVDFKFSGYLERQQEEIQLLKRDEGVIIPEDFPYDSITSLRTEAREKFKKYRPTSLGHALRIPGIPASAIALLAIHLKRFRSTVSQDPEAV
jgi:tRNA uridine 5-carboxymethylaminomethyl modification enzyme